MHVKIIALLLTSIKIVLNYINFNYIRNYGMFRIIQNDQQFPGAGKV